MDLVSIVIPAYNVENYLKECVHSLLHQSYSEYEIVIIDDGSTDSTYQICEELAAENSKVKIFHQENQGVSVARNNAMKHTIGKYIVFVDADDLVSVQYLETLVGFAKKADLGIIGFTSQMEELEKDIKVQFTHESSKNITDAILYGVRYDGYLWNKIFQRSIIIRNELKFKENITVWEDLFLFLSI